MLFIQQLIRKAILLSVMPHPQARVFPALNVSGPNTKGHLGSQLQESDVPLTDLLQWE